LNDHLPVTNPIMKNKVIFLLCLFGGIGLLIGLIVTTKISQFVAMGQAAEAMEMPPTSVSTYVVDKQVWPNELRAVGSIEPVQGVLLEAETAGVVDTINFSNGEAVEQGELLIQLDISVEQAQLKSAQASARLAEVEFARAERLRASGNVPQSELDRAVADLDKAKADVENIRAVIDRKTIRAPFSGKVGIRQINLGQYVPMGAPLVSLQANEQVYVNFTLPQQSLAKLQTGLPVILQSDAFPGRRFEGKVTAVSPQIDPTTRTVELQGTVDNPDGILRAGLFVEVAVSLPDKDEVIAVPATAIVYAPYGNSIYVIDEGEDGNLIAVQKFIRTGRVLGDFVEVTKGLESGDEIVSGEEVVSAGTFKLFNGAPVSIHNEMAPEAETAPTPPNT